MSLSKLREELLRELDAHLSSASYRRREQSFVLKRPPGFWAVHINFDRPRKDLELAMDVAVRYDAVERRLTQTVARLAPRERARTATLGVELGNWAEGRRHSWFISGAEDVLPVAAVALQLYRQVGIPFLERFSSLEELVRVLDAGQRDATLICPIPDRRAKVLAVARDLLSGRAA